MPNNGPHGYQQMPQAPYPIPGYPMPSGPGGPIITNQPHPGHQPLDNGSKYYLQIYVVVESKARETADH